MEHAGIERALDRVANALEHRNKLTQDMHKRMATPADASARAFGQPAEPRPERTELALVQGVEDIVQLAARKAWDVFSKKVSGPDDDSPTDEQVFVEECADAIRSCIDFRTDSEAKLAQAMGELFNLRRDSNKIKTDALKGVRALCLLHFVQSRLTMETNIKNFISAIDVLLELNTPKREVIS